MSTSKARQLADFISTGVGAGILADGAIDVSEISGLEATAQELNTLDGITATVTELNTLDGITVTSTEINTLSGVSSNIQSQIDNISSSVSAINTEVVTDTSPQLGGNLDLNNNNITGIGDVTITGGVTATSFSGDGSQLTGIEGVTAATLMKYGAI